MTTATVTAQSGGIDWDLLEHEAAEELATRPAAIELARANPVRFIDDFCWGKDFELGIVFKATLWPWQARLVRHLAGVERYSPETPFGVGRESPVASGRLPGEYPERYVLLKARGVGATWALIWYSAWLMWARPPAQVLIMSDVEDKAVDLCDRRLGHVLDNLPGPLTRELARRRGEDNKTGMGFANGSEVFSISGDPSNIHTYHPTLALLDEASRYRGSFLAAITGLQSQVVVFSTANGLGNDFARVYRDAQDNGGMRHRFVPIFVPWRDRPTYVRKPTGDPALEAQEYPDTAEEAFLTSGRPYFDLLQARQLARVVVQPPIRVEENGCLKIWREPGQRPEGHRRDAGATVYGIFADTAKGREHESGSPDVTDEHGGSDYSTAIVLDWLNGEQVAEWHGRPREFPFAHTLYGLWKRYPGLIVPERNGPGEIVCQRLAELDPTCVYHDPRDGRPGWINTEQTRRAALAMLHHSITTQELRMRSRAFWSEVDTFQVSPASGKPEAQAGYHDDRVLARAIGESVRTSMAPPRARPAVPQPARSLPRYGRV